MHDEKHIYVHSLSVWKTAVCQLPMYFGRETHLNNLTVGDDEHRIIITEFWLHRVEAVRGGGSTSPILAAMMTLSME